MDENVCFVALCCVHVYRLKDHIQTRALCYKSEWEIMSLLIRPDCEG